MIEKAGASALRTLPGQGAPPWAEKSCPRVGFAAFVADAVRDSPSCRRYVQSGYGLGRLKAGDTAISWIQILVVAVLLVVAVVSAILINSC